MLSRWSSRDTDLAAHRRHRAGVREEYLGRFYYQLGGGTIRWVHGVDRSDERVGVFHSTRSDPNVDVLLMEATHAGHPGPGVLLRNRPVPGPSSARVVAPDSVAARCRGRRHIRAR